MHVHTFIDLDGVQRVATYPEDCDYCHVYVVSEQAPEIAKSV